MDAQQFLAEFGHIANAKGGIQLLREMIYQLAITGALTSQLDTDGDARQLLANITSLRDRLIREKAYKRLPKLESEAIDIPLFIELPASWCWTRLLDIGEISPKNDAPDEASASFIPMSGFSEIHMGQLAPEATKWGKIKKGFTHFRNGDVVVAKITPCFENGKAAVIGGLEHSIGAGTTELHVFRPIHTGILPEYIYLFLRSPYFASEGEKNMTGTAGQKRLPTEYFATRALPLPTSAEQSRIVAKVDELMALCDKLETQQKDRRKLQNNLRQSTLQAVATASSPHELQISWARLADNFGRLFHTPEDVADIRQLAMDLAVRGLLTEQCDEDEAAFHLLARIALEHKEMVLNGEMKRPKPLSEIDLTDAPFELPRGWAWARFPEVGLFGRGKSKHRPRNDPKLFSPGIYPLVQTGEVARANTVINEYHSKYSEIGLAQSKLWPKGTLCITIAANIADAAILGFDACFPDSVVGFIPASELREEVEYFLLFMKTARERLLAFAPSTAQKNINLEILQSVLIPVPPKCEIKRILSRINEINALCDRLVDIRAKAQDTGKLLAVASVASITGIATEQNEEPMKVPQTELIAPLRLGKVPDIKAQSPLATILARHNGEMPAKDLWQRFGGDIDAFYAQLKTEVAHGWILEPAVAEMREKHVESVGA
ncbi:restriction endonuclease subunit S [Methylomonas sp. AM2-LC]|uniref:restriction endonuclease subunit S n=1 Tax=Methylomonas sp. AM2-LC TaxID=3153301 RepID=UPI003264D769